MGLVVLPVDCWKRIISPRDKQNVTEMIKCFNNQGHLPKKTNIFEWWDKQAESKLQPVANAAIALPVTQASVEKTFSGLRYQYILNESNLGLKEDLIEAIMFQRCNT